MESGIQQTFIVESGILRFGIRNTAQVIRNAAKDWNKDSRFHKQRRNRNALPGIQNPRLFTIPFHGAA